MSTIIIIAYAVIGVIVAIAVALIDPSGWSDDPYDGNVIVGFGFLFSVVAWPLFVLVGLMALLGMAVRR